MAQFIYWLKSRNQIELGQNGWKQWFGLKIGWLASFLPEFDVIHSIDLKAGPDLPFVENRNGAVYNWLKSRNQIELGQNGWKQWFGLKTGWLVSFLPEFDRIHSTDLKAGPDLPYFENRNGSVYILTRITEWSEPPCVRACVCVFVCVCMCVCVSSLK